jgi:DNA-binding LacI/PurR family transcriptional regulator
VIAYNDLVAFGLLSRLSARGIPVPHALSVVGCDDIGMSAMCHPALTTVSIPKRAAGRATVGLLLSMLAAGADASPVHRELPTQLIVRDTTGVAPSSPTNDPTKGSTR